MSSKRNRLVKIFMGLASIVITLACTISLSSPTSTPAPDSTKQALEKQATESARLLTQSALDGQAQPLVTEPPAGVPATEPPVPATDVPAPAAPDLDTLMKNANILVYENTDERNIGMWISQALDNLGLTYTNHGSYSGRFMGNLNSGEIYDLIIVGAEDKDIISGEFWDIINTRLIRDQAAMIAEIWYLDSEANGPISKIMGECGIAFRKDQDLADSIFWWDPTNPVLNEPNVLQPLIHFSRFWSGQSGDQIRLTGTGDAVMLAGLGSTPGDAGQIAVCMQGRVIFQTFSDHDYHEEDIVPLWENYIYNTLRAHFAAIQ